MCHSYRTILRLTMMTIVIFPRAYPVALYMAAASGELLWISSAWLFCRNPERERRIDQITNTDDRTLWQTCVTRWVARGGVGIACFSNIYVRLTRPANYRRSTQYVFEQNIFMLVPHWDQLRGARGLPTQNNIEADTKLTVVISCQIFTKSAHWADSV